MVSHSKSCAIKGSTLTLLLLQNCFKLAYIFKKKYSKTNLIRIGNLLRS